MIEVKPRNGKYHWTVKSEHFEIEGYSETEEQARIDARTELNKRAKQRGDGNLLLQ